ncbi:hypothetical protein [[Phormidium] sp. ETS-05]|nr:hypothetical protein [[Phormidium] sp. ETS-05]
MAIGVGANGHSPLQNTGYKQNSDGAWLGVGEGNTPDGGSKFLIEE